MQAVRAKLVAGHGVASGREGADTRFPDGTIRMQAPFFKAAGVDLEALLGADFVRGTLNFELPRRFTYGKPDHVLRAVRWTDIFPPENFFLSPARIEHAGAFYRAMLYVPDPSTKPDHFQAATVVEAIAEPVPGLSPGDEVVLHFDPAFIQMPAGDGRTD